MKYDRCVSPAKLAKTIRLFIKTKSLKAAKALSEIGDTICPCNPDGVDNAGCYECPFILEDKCFLFKCPRWIENDKELAVLYLEAVIQISKWDSAKRSLKDKFRKISQAYGGNVEL